MSELAPKHTFNISRAAIELVPNKANRNAYLSAGVLALLMLGVALYFWRALPERIPIFLTLPWGEGRLGPSYAIFGAGGLTLGVITLNIILSKLWGGGGSLIPRMLSVAAVGFAVGMSLALWGMIQSFFL